MFNKQAVRQTRIASFAIAVSMTLAMLLSINLLATSDAHAEQLAEHVDGSACIQV